MRITEKKEMTSEVNVLKSATCNKCGKSSEGWFEEEFDLQPTFTDIHSVDVHFEGEHTKYHTKRWEFDLCDDCLVEFVKTFKYAPDWFSGKGDYNQKAFDKWVADGCPERSRFGGM